MRFFESGADGEVAYIGAKFFSLVPLFPFLRLCVSLRRFSLSRQNAQIRYKSDQ
jgi:hypothetical protein